MRTAHALSGWEITLLVLGAPLWLPLLATFAALVLTVVAVMASVLATAYAVGLSLVACFAAGVITAIQFASDNLPAQAAAYGGFALASAGAHRPRLCREQLDGEGTVHREQKSAARGKRPAGCKGEVK